jgi:hypothetical protein
MFDTLEKAQEAAEQMITVEGSKIGGVTLIGSGSDQGKYDVRLFDKMEESKADKTWVQKMEDSKDDKTWLIEMQEVNQVFFFSRKKKQTHRLQDRMSDVCC